MTNVPGLEFFTSQVSTTASISSLLGSYADESESSTWFGASAKRRPVSRHNIGSYGTVEKPEQPEQLEQQVQSELPVQQPQ